MTTVIIIINISAIIVNIIVSTTDCLEFLCQNMFRQSWVYHHGLKNLDEGGSVGSFSTMPLNFSMCHFVANTWSHLQARHRQDHNAPPLRNREIGATTAVVNSL